MPRPPRIQSSEVLYHVTTRGMDRRDIYLDDLDRVRFMELLERVVTEYDWLLYAYCLMGNHYHLVFETPQANIAAGMQFLNGDFARYFNEMHDREGHLFERRYRSIVAASDEHLLELSRYVVLNPVRARWHRYASEWPWSSFRATVGLAPPTPFVQSASLLAHFGSDPRRARVRYAEFVAEGATLPRMAMAA